MRLPILLNSGGSSDACEDSLRWLRGRGDLRRKNGERFDAPYSLGYPFPLASGWENLMPNCKKCETGTPALRKNDA